MSMKIAVLTNGWNNQNFARAIKGLQKFESEYSDIINFHFFVSFSTWSLNQQENTSEEAIFKLPELSSYDGVMIFSSMLTDEARTMIHKAVLKAGIPAISIGQELEFLKIQL